MGEGWVKIHRKMRKHWLRTDPVCSHVWTQLLLDANWERRQLKNGTFLERGELVIGQAKYAKTIGLSRQQLRSALLAFEKCEMLTNHATKRGTRLTICNYSTYQDDFSESNQPCNQQATNSQPTSNQQATNKQPQNKKGRIKELQEGKNLFRAFWDAYPSGRKKNKPGCEKKFMALPSDDQQAIVACISDFANSGEGRSGDYCRLAQTWLNQKGWEDDRECWQRKANQRITADVSEGTVFKANGTAIGDI